MLSVRWWDLAAIVVASVIVVLTLIDPPYGPSEWGAWAAAAAFLIVYFAGGRRLNLLVMWNQDGGRCRLQRRVRRGLRATARPPRPCVARTCGA